MLWLKSVKQFLVMRQLLLLGGIGAMSSIVTSNV